MSQVLSASATPAELNQIASLNSQLNEEEMLYGQPSTASLTSTSPDVADFVDLSNATLDALGGTPATTTTTTPATTATPTLASPGFSVLG